jgi:outer membrane protein assembly factor BamB
VAAPVRNQLAIGATLLAIGVLAGCGGSSHTGASATTAPATPAAPTTGPPTTAAQSRAGGWVTYGHDAQRTGVDPTSPPAGSVGPAWTTPALDGAVYAQPLVVGATVIVATENNTVYAFEAATGTERWVRHLGAPVPGSALPCGNIDPSGITSTPVVDTERGVVWAVSFSLPAQHLLWGLSLTSGAVISSRDVDPPGANVLAEQQRGALVMVGSRVYVPYGGLFGDCSNYHGWVVGMSTSIPSSPAKVTYETPTARSAIWAPPGPVAAADGSIYVATGNGLPVDVAGQSDTVLRLSPSLEVQSTFTPADYVRLSATDADLGSTSPALLPDGLVFQIGKEGVGYVLHAAELGGVGGEAASARICDGGFGGTAVDGDVVFVSCYDGLYAIRVSPKPALLVSWSVRSVRPGPPTVAGGVVWVVDKSGALAGFSESSGSRVYRHSLSVAGSFPSPAAAGGRLFVPDGNRVAAFGGV